MVMIEKMKFLSITGPKADIDRMTETYLSKYEIHLENALSELTEVANLSPFLEINPYKEALSTIDSFYEQLEDPSQISPEPMDIEKAIKTVRAVQDGFRRLEEEKSRLQSEHAEILDPLKIIRPFKNLNFDVSEILNFKYIHYRFGRIEKQYLQKFEKYIYDNLDTLFIKCGEDEMYVYGVYFVPEHQAHKVHAVYSSMHFERIFIPNEYHGTAAEAFEKLDTRHREIHKALDANKEASRKFLQDNSTKIVSAKAALDACSSSFDIRKLAACTPGDTNTFYILCGWMTEKDALAFRKDIQNDEKIFCLMEDQKAPATQKPPTKLRNPKLFKPFEMYVKMYGLPAYNEMDPTWFVAITYSFIFGAMFGDVGQGLVLFLGGLFLYKTKKMDLAGIISCAGVFSVFFGKNVAVAFYDRRAIRIRFVQHESKRIISAVFRLRRAVERVSIARRKRYVILSDIQAFHGDFNRTRYVFYHIRFSVRRRGKLATVGFHFKVSGIVAFLYYQRKSISFAVNRFRIARKRICHALGGCGYGILIFRRALHRNFQRRFHVFHGVFAVFFRYRFAVDFHNKRALIVARGFRYGKRIIFAVNSLCRTGYFVAFARWNRYGIRFLFNAAHGDIQIGRYVFHRVFAVRFRKQSIVGFHRKRGSFVSFTCNFKRESIIFAAVHGICAVQFVPLARAERYPVYRIRNLRGIIGNGFVVLRFHFHRIRIHRRKRVERERFLRFQVVAVHVYHIRRCFRNGLPRYGKIVVQYDFRRGERFRFFPIGIVVARGKAGCR